MVPYYIYIYMVYGTANGPQNDIGNYLGPCRNILHGRRALYLDKFSIIAYCHAGCSVSTVTQKLNLPPNQNPEIPVPTCGGMVFIGVLSLSQDRAPYAVITCGW